MSAPKSWADTAAILVDTAMGRAKADMGRDRNSDGDPGRPGKPGPLAFVEVDGAHQSGAARCLDHHGRLIPVYRRPHSVPRVS